ncbi:hypothetical protein U8P80_36280 (plasmid) [Rhizobium beringeri]|nr:hypothetical protein U8P80_36280 [Rhizobium beringeri]WSH18676.1 hypothetical protein U8P74_36280 [Rhizobium beringeri]
MPHLAALASDGTWSRRHTTVFPSETRGRSRPWPLAQPRR